MDTKYKKIAKLFVDAFDVDVQIYMSELLKQLKSTPTGVNFATWAEENPTKFRNLIRTISVTIQQIPITDNLLVDKITNHLARLPIELDRAVNYEPISTNKELNMEDFNKKYEEALEGLSDEQLEQVANLDQKQLKEWINSPVKIRPFLLKKWNQPKKSTVEKTLDPISKLGNKLKEIDENMAKPLREENKRLEEKLKKMQNKRKFKFF